MVTGEKGPGRDSHDAMCEHFFGSPARAEIYSPPQDMKYEEWLHFGAVRVNRMSGEVDIPADGNLSELSRAFWRMVKKASVNPD